MLNIITLIIFFIVIAAVIALQIILSKKNNKWLGLILPIVSLLFSILLTFYTANYSTASITEHTISDDGTVIEREIYEKASTNGSVPLSALFLFLFSNIWTIIFIAIYLVCRGKRRKENLLEKMSIQDLE